jgi:hypothetical protein
MSTLKWHDHEPSGDGHWFSEARTAYPIRGRYRISYRPGGYKNWRDEIVEPLFEVEFRRSYSSNWRLIGVHHTIYGALWTAEEDHTERLQAAVQEAATAW